MSFLLRIECGIKSGGTQSIQTLMDLVIPGATSWNGSSTVSFFGMERNEVGSSVQLFIRPFYSGLKSK